MLRRLLEKNRPRFEKGGKLERLHPLFEMAETFLFSPGKTTRQAPHVRDGIDLKRLMATVVFALFPAASWGVYNTGLQAHRLIEAGGAPLPGWREAAFTALGFTHDSGSVAACLVFGALWVLPLFIAVYAAGGLVEVGFALVRRHEVNEGFLVTGFLIPLIVPPTLPLWQAALGTVFGVLVGKEIFGGTGMNFLNPALTARAFLFFAYPAQISGDVWIAARGPDAVTGATWLGRLANGPVPLTSEGWWEAFWGRVPGSVGETSVPLILLGALVLVVTRVASGRIMLSVLAGTAATSLLFGALSSGSNPMLSLPLHWHLVLGGWAFGTVFMATDPVTAAFTPTGKIIYGVLIGVLVVLIRAVNPAYPEGMMLAILFANMFAPLIDHFVVQANIRRRLAHYGR